MKENLKIGLLSAQNELLRYKFTVLREEIDDNINQLLSSIKMLLGIIGKNGYPLADIVETTQGTLTTAIQELHSLSNCLNDLCLNNFDLIEYLKTEIERINHWKKANITLTISTKSLPLTMHAQVLLFIIMIEVLTNNIEQVKEKAVSLDLREGEFIVTIINSNKSIRTELPRNCLKKIRNYIKLIGGEIYLSAGQKFDGEIKVSLPINH